MNHRPRGNSGIKLSEIDLGGLLTFGNVVELQARNRKMGLCITSKTPVPLRRGEKMDNRWLFCV